MVVVEVLVGALAGADRLDRAPPTAPKRVKSGRPAYSLAWIAPVWMVSRQPINHLLHLLT